ncbi:MAG: integrase, partial [Anaerolinea sp.]|nr:integrase [Anaerolinea sp.]
MSNEDYRRAADVASATGETLPTGREFAPDEISGLIVDCVKDPTPAGARDAAMISLMYSCGLRRDEVANLTLDNYDPETGRLAVVGKRAKERTAYLTN